MVNAGQPFYALAEGGGGDDGQQIVGRCITLFDAPGMIATCPEAANNGDHQVERRVVEALRRLSDKAMEMGERIALQPGDMLIMNNARCVHGRTAYKPRLDDTDRWLIKTYTSNGLWKKPSQPNNIHALGGGRNRDPPLTFPAMDFPQ